MVKILAVASIGMLFASCAPTRTVPADQVAEITGVENKKANFPKLEQSWAQTVYSTKAAHDDLAASTPKAKANLNRVFGDDSESTRKAVLATLDKMHKDPIKRGYRLTLVGKDKWAAATKSLKTHEDSEIAALSIYGYNRPIIMLSENYFERKPSDRTPTLVHELSHQAAGTKDHAYNLGSDYTHGATETKFVKGVQASQVASRSGSPDKIGLSLQKRIENADTIARFVMLYR